MKVQINLVYALIAVYNYIRTIAGVEELETGLDPENVNEELVDESENISAGFTASRMDKKRDEIAAEMWNDYIIYRSTQ